MSGFAEILYVLDVAGPLNLALVYFERTNVRVALMILLSFFALGLGSGNGLELGMT
jgi:hypothetical protein